MFIFSILQDLGPKHINDEGHVNLLLPRPSVLKPIREQIAVVLKGLDSVPYRYLARSDLDDSSYRNREFILSQLWHMKRRVLFLDKGHTENDARCIVLKEG